MLLIKAMEEGPERCVGDLQGCYSHHRLKAWTSRAECFKGEAWCAYGISNFTIPGLLRFLLHAI